ncbi:MAG: CARDB domain-containing protein [Haloarculaceae archaeon]
MTFPWAAIAGEEVTVQVSVENTGNSSGTYEAALQADEEELTSDSVEVDAGKSTTLTLTHVFEETGDYDLTVAGEERQITVYDTLLQYLDSEDTDRGGLVTEEETEIDAVMNYQGQQIDFSSESTATVRTNYTAETQYTEAESTITVAEETWDETTEEWIVGGTLYKKTVDHSTGETTYVKEQSDEFEDDSNPPTEAQAEYVRTDHTDDEYVVIVEANNPEDAATLAALLNDDSEEDLPPESLESIYMEFHVDRQLVRPNSVSMDISATDLQMDDSGGGFETFDMTMTQEMVEYDATVDVEVPDEVKDYAEYE